MENKTKKYKRKTPTNPLTKPGTEEHTKIKEMVENENNNGNHLDTTTAIGITKGAIRFMHEHTVGKGITINELRTKLENTTS